LFNSINVLHVKGQIGDIQCYNDPNLNFMSGTKAYFLKLWDQK